MSEYLKHWLWFIKESYLFMGHKNKVWITMYSIPKAFVFARDMRKWDKLTAEQRENWYLSGEGRTFEY